MTNTFKRLTFAALVAASAIATYSAPAFAATHPDGNGGAVCKGIGSCLVLELDCKGTYIDATQPDGTVYGKCTQLNQTGPRAIKQLKAN